MEARNFVPGFFAFVQRQEFSIALVLFNTKNTEYCCINYADLTPHTKPEHARCQTGY